MGLVLLASGAAEAYTFFNIRWKFRIAKFLACHGQTPALGL
jgi:hypothetical protein